MLVTLYSSLFCNEVSVNLNIFCPIMPMCLVVMQAGLQMLYRVLKRKTMSKQAARTALPPFPPWELRCDHSSERACGMLLTAVLQYISLWCILIPCHGLNHLWSAFFLSVLYWWMKRVSICSCRAEPIYTRLRAGVKMHSLSHSCYGNPRKRWGATIHKMQPFVTFPDSNCYRMPPFLDKPKWLNLVTHWERVASKTCHSVCSAKLF